MTKVTKGQFWKRDTGHIWVRFIFYVDEKEYRFLEYIPNGVVPACHCGTYDDRMDEYFEQINYQEANKLIQNISDQDIEYAFRLGMKMQVEELAKAMKILEYKSICSVEVQENAVHINIEDGSSYEIAIGREGFVSRKTGESDI